MVIFLFYWFLYYLLLFNGWKNFVYKYKWYIIDWFLFCELFWVVLYFGGFGYINLVWELNLGLGNEESEFFCN